MLTSNAFVRGNSASPLAAEIWEVPVDPVEVARSRDLWLEG